jgi:hypothetical protein
MRTDGTQPWPTSTAAGGYQPSRRLPDRARSPTPDAELDALQRRAWQEQGVAMLRVDDIADPLLRQAIINEAARRWGRRQQGGSLGR